MSEVTKSGIINAIKTIDEPGFDINHLMLTSIKKLEVKGNSIDLFISLPVPPNAVNEPMKKRLKESIEKNYPGIKKVNLEIEAKGSFPQEPQKEQVLPGVKNTIAVASGKGGVGKSTVAVNLAVALASEGAKVGLLDADIYGPSIPLMLGINEKPKVYQSRTTAKMIPLENYGIKLMSIGFLVDDSTPVIWRGPMASGALKQFMTDVEWEELDYLLYDMPPGTGDIQLTLVQTVPLSGAVIVTTPQEVSLVDARKGLKMFARVNVPVLGIVENMSYFIAPDTGKRYDIFGSGGGEKLAAEGGVPFLGGIPIDPRIREGGDKGIPIVFDMPGTEHSKIIIEIARNIKEQVRLNNLNADSSGIQISLDED